MAQPDHSKTACDLIIERAVMMMQNEAGAPVEMIIDRLLTYAAAQASIVSGSSFTAQQFREFAKKIEAGAFHGITGEGQRH